MSEGKVTSRSSFMPVDWKIQNFFSSSWKVGDYIESPHFCFLCGTWRLRMYPNGDALSPEYINICLIEDCSDSLSDTPCIEYRIGIRKRDGTEQCIRSTVQKEDIRYNGCYFRFSNIISRSEFVRRKEEFTLGNVVTVFCVLSVRVNAITEATSQTESGEGINNFVLNLENLLLSGKESDVTLSVGGQEFRCHRVILAARSSVFAAMLRQDMLEKNTGVVVIEDCEPGAFWEFLTYLYSGSVRHFSRENALGLYYIADKYDSQDVKTKCVPLLMSGLSMDNICNVFALSIRHNESELLKTAVNFFARNAKNIFATVKWQNFLREDPVCANDLYLKALDHYIIPE